MPPRGVQLVRDGARVIVSWQGALAGPEPLRWYRIYAGDTLLASQAFRPQLTVEPLSVVLEGMDDQALASGRIRVVAE